MRKVGGVSEILGVGSQLFYTPVIPENVSNQLNRSSVSIQNPPASPPGVSPKMSDIFKNSNTIKVGYIGKLGFWDNQAAFVEVFGDKPTIIPQNPVTP